MSEFNDIINRINIEVIENFLDNANLLIDYSKYNKNEKLKPEIQKILKIVR